VNLAEVMFSIVHHDGDRGVLPFGFRTLANFFDGSTGEAEADASLHTKSLVNASLSVTWNSIARGDLRNLEFDQEYPRLGFN
jgi:hypothetical protein